MKKLELEISSCSECPYVQYYDHGRYAGYECRETGKKIVDQWEVCNSNNPDPKGWPEIPNWCPL